MCAYVVQVLGHTDVFVCPDRCDAKLCDVIDVMRCDAPGPIQASAWRGKQQLISYYCVLCFPKLK